jgi:hypothetical protein
MVLLNMVLIPQKYCLYQDQSQGGYIRSIAYLNSHFIPGYYECNADTTMSLPGR